MAVNEEYCGYKREIFWRYNENAVVYGESRVKTMMSLKKSMIVGNVQLSLKNDVILINVPFPCSVVMV